MRIRFAASACSGLLLVLAVAGCSADAGSTASETAPSTSTCGGADGDAASDAFLGRLEAGMGEKVSRHGELRMTGPGQSTAQGDTTYGPGGSEMQLRM